jgi:hypothetical protein
MKLSFVAKNIFPLITAFVLLENSAQTLRAQDSPPPDTDASANPSATLPTDIAPGSPLAQVVQLAQSGVDESVIMSFIKSSGPFNLTSDQIIYLKDLGLPADAVTTMLERDKELGAATTAATPTPTVTTQVAPEQPQEVTQNYFYDTLSPYGGWVNVSGCGLCWRPTVAIYDSSWQPYCDHGHWISTDAGWYWSSDYGWGNCAFHYGRWFHDAHAGWCWWPDTVWAPSWVTWRYANDYCGWAPLPPHTVFHPGVGIYFNGGLVGAGFDFGIRANFFTFVPTGHFNDPHINRFRASPSEVTKIYNHTTIINNYTVNNHDHTFINNGIPPERITAVTHKNIPRMSIQESPSSVPRDEQLKRNTLVIHRPNISQNNVSALNQGIKPAPVHENISQQHNFSTHANSQPNQPSQNNIPTTTHAIQPASHVNPIQQNNVSAPVQSIPHSAPIEPTRPASPPNNAGNYNSENHTVSTKEQQLQERSSVRNSFHESPPVEHSSVNETHTETHVNNSAPAPKNSESSAPPASSKSDKDQNGPGH